MEHTPAEPRDVRNGASHLYMKYRIHKILLVCCSYDGYILEEDGTSNPASRRSTST